MTHNRVPDKNTELFDTARAAYSAAMLDAAKAIESGLTPDELRRFASDNAEAYALNVTIGSL